MTKVISKASCPIITDDPRESTVQNLTWYGSRLFRALGMVCHLTAPNREGADLQTARYALVAGMAFGFDKPLLMLSEGNILTPIDYRDLLKSYSTATEAIAHVQKWVDPIVDNYQSEAAPKGDHLAPAKLATDLQSLRFGEYVAEDEAETLIERYFLPTAEYQAALDGVQTLFVGRRGTGKTANLLKLEDDLSRDRRNLVCVIKPVAYEMQGIVSLLRTYRQQDTKGFAIESLWKFLLITEIASAAASRIREKLDQAIQPKERDFIKFIDDNQALILSDFSVRLERCVKTLMAAGSADSADVQSARLAISESLHAGILQHLRSELGDILSPIERVVILVDNLDKAWDKQSDIEVMSEVLLGLIGTATRIPQDFSRTDSRRQRVRISLTIFLRSDIFHQVKRIAREPDKLRFAKLQWHDRSLLLRVLEERFVASFEGNIDASELWNRYFCRLVRGKPTKDYIIGTVLDRPRDLIYFVNAAVSIAVNRKHGFINEQDLIDAEKQYSQYAFESIIVENTLRGLDLEAALIEFAGAPCVLGANQIAVLLKSVDLSKDGVGELVELLCSLTFFGLEVDKDRFVFSDDPQEHKRNQVQARRYAHSKNSEPRYSIHPAFRAFLEIE